MDEKDRISREALFASISSEASGFYKMIVAIASSFLGGSLLYLEKISPKYQSWTLVLLVIGWSALVGSILLIVQVRRQNLESGRHALGGKWEEASAIDETTRRQSNWATILLGAGIALIMIFGIINVASFKGEEENIAMANQKSQNKKSIPYGSAKPTQDKPTDTGAAPNPKPDQTHSSDQDTGTKVPDSNGR